MHYLQNIYVKFATDNIRSYRKISSNGEPIFTNGKNYITPDNTGHNGVFGK